MAAGQSCRVMADRSDAELLCLHLLSNALRACSAGGKVRLMLRRMRSFWQLTVMDNGCGLPEAGEDSMAGEPALLSGRRKAGPAALPRVLPPYGLGPAGGAACTGKGHTGSGDHSAVRLNRIMEPTVELHTGGDTAQAQQHQYQLRNMLVRELRTMPERGDPDEL
ncbi:MAG: ATP-binding protein [Faecalibacterium sp.]